LYCWTVVLAVRATDALHNVAADDPPPKTGLAPEIEDLLQRHLRFDPTSRSRDVLTELQALGFLALPHRPTTGRSKYVRLLRRGSDGREAVLYLNSRALVSSSRDDHRAFLAGLPGADVRAN